jgi:polyisoprenoid-binding protein YceI
MNRHAITAFAIFLASTSAHATPYVFEPRHSQGVMRWSHLGFSNPTAKFSLIEGMLEWNAADPSKSSVKATIPMSGLSTGVPDLDDDFRSTDFFDFAKFPSATFTSTHIAKTAGTNHYTVTGDLAVHGVTKAVTLDATINKVGDNPRNHLPSVGFEATATLKRSDFGLGRYVPQVSDEIRIELTMEAADAAEALAQLRQAGLKLTRTRRALLELLAAGMIHQIRRGHFVDAIDIGIDQVGVVGGQRIVAELNGALQ